MHQEKEQWSTIEKERSLLKKKGYNNEKDCQTWACQIKGLGLNASELPDLNEKERCGVVKRLSVVLKKSEENTVVTLDKFISGGVTWERQAAWYRYVGSQSEFIVVLRPSAKIINNTRDLKEIKINFVGCKDEPTNRYRKDVLIIGITKLFETNKNPDFYWDKDVYLIAGGTSTGKSSGVALIIALYSAYFNKKIPSNLAATGVIDKNGNVSEIARLTEKIQGVLQKGTNIFVLPKSNFSKEKIPIILYNQIKKLHPVSNCYDLLNLLYKGNFE